MLLYELCSVRTRTYRETRIKRAVFSNLRGRRELQLYTTQALFTEAKSEGANCVSRDCWGLGKIILFDGSVIITRCKHNT